MPIFRPVTARAAVLKVLVVYSAKILLRLFVSRLEAYRTAMVILEIS